MSTRSTIKFIEVFNGEKTELVNIYQQYDGYINGVGHELANWLNKIKLTNGFNYDMKMGEYANGVGCLAAQFIKDFKVGVGGLYIVPLYERQSYNYEVIIDSYSGKIKIYVSLFDPEKVIFTGTPTELLSFEG